MRFVLVGASAALVNIGARVVFSFAFSFEIAVALAFPFGLLTAFLLTKNFVFREGRGSAVDQLARFTLVNLAALGQVWIVSVFLVDWLFPILRLAWHAELIGHALGVLSPVFSSYLAHKHYSFRSIA